MDKYIDAEKLGQRIADNKYTDSIVVNNEDSAKTEVVFTNKQIGMDFDGLRIFFISP